MQKEIYFHVGLGKTASTWMQNKVFPKLQGIHYIHPTKYRKFKQIIESTNYSKYFISREMDQQLEREVIKFSALYPDAKPILVLRSNESWIASQYRRFLKNGYPYTFKEFFDVENDTGFWKRSDAEFYPKIEILEKYFTKKPLVLLYEDLRTAPFDFIDAIAGCMGATYNRDEISLEKHHSSYEEKQLKVMLPSSKMLFTKNPKYNGSRVNTWLRRRSRMMLCYALLYGAYLVPNFLISKKELISKEELEKVKAYFSADWDKCVQYAKQARQS